MDGLKVVGRIAIYGGHGCRRESCEQALSLQDADMQQVSRASYTVARLHAQLEVAAPDAARAPGDEVVVDVGIHGRVGIAHPRLALRRICGSALNMSLRGS